MITVLVKWQTRNLLMTLHSRTVFHNNAHPHGEELDSSSSKRPVRFWLAGMGEGHKRGSPVIRFHKKHFLWLMGQWLLTLMEFSTASTLCHLKYVETYQTVCPATQSRRYLLTPAVLKWSMALPFPDIRSKVVDVRWFCVRFVVI